EEAEFVEVEPEA
nr:Chain B, Sorting and assembly machinery component 50 homolog [Homo sapiens]